MFGEYKLITKQNYECSYYLITYVSCYLQFFSVTAKLKLKFLFQRKQLQFQLKGWSRKVPNPVTSGIIWHPERVKLGKVGLFRPRSSFVQTGEHPL